MQRQTFPTVSAIVPVYNEETTVAGVIQALLGHGAFCEVICINDGSRDRSLAVLRSFGEDIGLIHFEENRGKGHALAAGIAKAKGELVVFVDADLTNLSAGHIEDLLSPVLRGEARAVLGFSRRGEVPNLAAHLTGQRVYHRVDLLPYLDRIRPSRFGVEILLNDLFKGEDVAMVPLQDLIGLTKVEKRRPTQAIVEYVREGLEIVDQILKRRVVKLRRPLLNLGERLG